MPSSDCLSPGAIGSWQPMLTFEMPHASLKWPTQWLVVTDVPAAAANSFSGMGFRQMQQCQQALRRYDALRFLRVVAVVPNPIRIVTWAMRPMRRSLLTRSFAATGLHQRHEPPRLRAHTGRRRSRSGDVRAGGRCQPNEG